MKSWKRAVTVALCAASLLAGCGGDCGLSDDDSADEPQITLEQLRAANDQRSLLEKHDTVTVTVQESDQNDAVTVSLPVHRKQHQRQSRAMGSGERSDGCRAYGERQHRGSEPEHLP